MSGILSGGWNFVLAAYTVSAIILGGYVAHVIRAFRATRSDAS